ncbi:SGNH/GDSL hydrolase family protein [Caballeronia sp. TF1N1]|uniref:SGNH/GDSL hydrolase family protein n=1 Tax=Caballeronia sp. TF1N1 TaxID=2878153 RepID=UPI001FD38E2D|nr:SGNH/GDSL hydrolase family protein [Caballeronia sp. TF1N1]
MPLVLKNQAAGDVANPDAGYSTLFPDQDGNFSKKDSAGAVTKLGAGGAASSSAYPIPNLEKIRRIIPFGDSITANNSTYSNGAYQASNGWAENALRKASRFTFMKNAGIGGNTVANMRARLAADILAAKPDAITLLGGTNSIVTGTTFQGMAAVLNDYEYIVQQCLFNGIVPILLTPPAKSKQGLDNQDNTGWYEMRDFIPFLYDLANFYSLPLIDLHKFTADSATGGYRAGLSDDGVHPSAVGHRRIAEYAAYFLHNPHEAVGNIYLSGVSEFGESGRLHNIIQNGCFDFKITDDADNPTPYLAAWGPQAVGTNTDVLVPFGGNSADAQVSGKQFKFTTPTGGKYFPNGLDSQAYSAGDVLEFSGRVTAPAVADADINSGDVGLNVFLAISKTDGTPDAQAKIINDDKNSQDTLFSIEVVVPPNPQEIDAAIYVVGAGDYSFSNFTVTNKTVRQSYWKPGTLQA